MTDVDSALRFYSFGIVVKDKIRGSDDITVYPVEHLPMVSGAITGVNTPQSATSTNIKGVPNTVTVKQGNTVTAKWARLSGSNRATSPDVYRNETVILLTVADTGVFYWEDFLREPTLRRKEHVCYMYSNLDITRAASGTKPYDKKSSYWFEVSTADKHVKLHTSDNDGEVCTYDISVDGKAGELLVNDGFNNLLRLVSRAGVWYVSANTGVDVRANKYVNITAPEINLNGNVRVSGTTSIGGDLAVGGNSAIAGSSTANPHFNCVV